MFMIQSNVLPLVSLKLCHPRDLALDPDLHDVVPHP